MTGESGTIPGVAKGRAERPAVPVTAWRKSSYSNHNGACVEVADRGPETVAFRDSKAPDGPVLGFVRGSAEAFIAAVALGRL
ncbi:DUF397 domain-containing protein [Streptomyces lushanensis]|uniref:DUF397 domain-containing protein n=1 Tax=Streptomyces lushanensis TaxID=1434255 RepID=UPI00099F4F50|nr:DUF397 domain-containing protein [Streptomyces lushanensis]